MRNKVLDVKPMRIRQGAGNGKLRKQKERLLWHIVMTHMKM